MEVLTPNQFPSNNQNKNMKHRPPSPAQEQEKCDRWNQHRPTGTKVEVRLDDGSIRNTTTRSEAWLMGGHTAVIMLEGISGGYMLERVRPL